MQLDDMFRLAEYVVEVSNYERQSLWEKHHEANNWKSAMERYGRQIGEIGDRPIWATFSLETINGLRVLFWEATSQLVDYKMIEDYLEKHCNPLEYDSKSRANCNAENFHDCLNYSKKDRAESLAAKHESKS